MVGWHHRHNGHEFEQTLGDSERQGSLAYSRYSMRLQRVGPQRRLSAEELILSNCGVGEDS